ncbi:MAG: 2,3-bisphosphoglycerate-independent phosphoglycerate mutase [Actinobacteria bacterium]|nr:2,3-bisphosphoglycerate-independent phosphoglycerate mutase [Actinomycetota bacterium]
MHTPALLAILDGFGIAPAGEGNAITRANKPYLDRLFTECPMTTLSASGEDVGLPDGQMGNSEVGHLNIGAGRVVYQELTRINRAIADGSFFENETLCAAIDAAKAADATVHCMGLLSNGGVHSDLEHLKAIVSLAVSRGVSNVHIHAFLDGRDVPPKSAVQYLGEIVTYCELLSQTTASDVRIATVCGRYYAMDRDNRWDRVEKAWRTLVLAEGPVYPSAHELIEASYNVGVTDEFVIPSTIEGAHAGIGDDDAIIFFNFRPDRAREICRAFTDTDFELFPRSVFPKVHFVCLTEYDPEIDAPVAFPKTFPQHVLADYLAENGLRQYHIAETEKYAHVTFFLNGGIEESKPNEVRVLIPSPKDVATYDLKPQMSAAEVADTLIDAIEHDAADVYIVNFANCDMVGHTGSIPAAIAAVEAVDEALGRVVDALLAKGGAGLITADHGNAEKMLDDDGETPFTAHTLSRVPLVLVGDDTHTLCASESGKLADIAPTFVELIGLEVPPEWTGVSLLA